MTTCHDKPADTKMMSVVHDALRRDLARLQTALSASPPPGAAQRRALAGHIDWMMDFLHHHHHGEDTGLWPLLRQRNPQAGPVLDRMEADHARIALAVELLRQAARRYATNGSEQDRASVADALSALAETLLPHLRGEEDDAMPLVSATLTDTEWRAWDQQHNVRGKSLSRLAAEGHWLMDGLDPDRRDVLLHLVPAPARIIIVKGYARRYRASCARRWGPDVNVAPRPVAA
jgi:hemerythrin-like domain-containing protein